jgi:hypothetical protein
LHIRDASNPAFAMGVDFETDDLLARKWWSVPEIAASEERFYPPESARAAAAIFSGRNTHRAVRVVAMKRTLGGVARWT